MKNVQLFCAGIWVVCLIALCAGYDLAPFTEGASYFVSALYMLQSWMERDD